MVSGKGKQKINILFWFSRITVLMVPHTRVEVGLGFCSGNSGVQKRAKLLLTLGAEVGVEFKGRVLCIAQHWQHPAPQSLGGNCMMGRSAENEALGMQSCKSSSPRPTMSLTCVNPASTTFAVRNELENRLKGGGEQTGGPDLTAAGVPEWF